MEILRKLSDNESVFYIGSENQVDAYISFVKQGDLLIIEHTVVGEKLKGQGIGKLLVEEVVNYARENDFVVNATCSFAHGLLYSQEKYEDIRA